MDTHINKLSKLCHICSKTAITGGGYSNAKTVYYYQIALATYIKIDIKWRQRGESLEDTGVNSYYNEEVLEI